MCCGQEPCKTNMTEEEEEREREQRKRERAQRRDILYALSLHMSPLLNLLGIHGCLSEEHQCFVLFMWLLKSLLLAWVSRNKKMDHFLFHGCGFVCRWANNQMWSMKNDMIEGFPKEISDRFGSKALFFDILHFKLLFANFVSQVCGKIRLGNLSQ